MASELRDFATVQEALDFVAQHPSMDELMSRRGPSRSEIALQINLWRADRVRWRHAADVREARKEGEEE